MANKPMKKPKVLIVTVPLGGGHMATAKALAAEFKANHPEVEVEVADVFRDIKLIVPIEQIMRPAYESSVRLLKSYPYKFFYNVSEKQVRLLNKFIVTALERGKLPAYLKEKDPDVIITTYPLGGALTHTVKRRWFKDVPVISVITDTGRVHKLWLMGDMDLLLAPTVDTAEFMIKEGIAKDRVLCLGFPVSPKFQDLPTKAEARRKLGLKNKPTALISGGGLGLNTKMLRLAEYLAISKIDAQLLFICGHNNSLKDQIKALDFKCDTRTYGFVDNVPELLAASDFVVGKAGWISVYEAMVARRPQIIVDVVPGQEEPNAEFVEKHGVGVVIKIPKLAAYQIEHYLKRPAELASYESAFERLGLDPRAATKIVQYICSTYLPETASKSHKTENSS